MKSRTYVMDARAEAVADTRRRIIDAARELFTDEWFDDVTLQRIAAGAGVSHQTVLNHFESKEGVFAAVANDVEAEIVARDAAAGATDTKAALTTLLARYEEMGMSNVRLVLQEHRIESIHELLGRARAHHRAWIERVWADRLPQAGAPRRQMIAALLAATEVMAWKAIRFDYGFSKADATAAVTMLVAAIEGGTS